MNTIKRLMFLFLCVCLVACIGCSKNPMEPPIEEPPVTEEPVEPSIEEPSVYPSQTQPEDGIWESVPNTLANAPDKGVTITLSVDAAQGMIDVKTSPKRVDSMYYFEDGAKIKYFMRGDSLYIYPHFMHDPDNRRAILAYIRTFHSVDSMRLDAVGTADTFNTTAYFPTYLFIRKKNIVFYYYGSEKIYLERDSRVKFMQFAKSTSEEDKENLIGQLKKLSIKVEFLDPYLYKISGNFKQEQVGSLLLKSLKDDLILYFSDMLKSYDGYGILWESNEIIVKLFPGTILSDLLDSNKVPFKEVKRLGSDTQTYIVTLDISEKSPLEYANMLVERKAVEWAEPSFWMSVNNFI